MLRVFGYLMIVAGIPLTFFLCFPGLACMAVGALLVMAGRKR